MIAEREAIRKGHWNSMMRVSVLTLTLLLFCATAAHAEEKQGTDPASSQLATLQQGERIYREGILPSGEPLQAVVKGDIPVVGTAFSCVSCHLRSGLGSLEGGVITPPTTGKKLYQPLYAGRERTHSERKNVPAYFQSLAHRPAYTDETLAAALRMGVGPGGQELNSVMPRYFLDDRDRGVLISYLKALSAESSPGVTETALRFATIVTEGVSDEDREAMLVPLQTYVAARNNQAKNYQTRAKYGVFAEEMDLSYRKLSLSVWELKGPAETWRAQLEEYYRGEQVFALLGGIAAGEWKPIHVFSEEHRIPCIFPITDFPVVSETDWYTLYFSKGLYQEGEAAAKHLARMEQLSAESPVLQLVQDSRAGRALQAGFESAWQELGRGRPLTVTLQAGEPIAKDLLQRLVEKDKPAVILLWTDAGAMPALEKLAAPAARPRRVYLSSSLLKQGLWTIPEPVRDIVFMAYPFRLPQEEKAYTNYARGLLRGKNTPIDDRRISTRMYSLVRLMTETFMHIRRDYYRDYFLDVISMLSDQEYPDYVRLSFGPGQRYASKGCYIVQLTPGPNPELVRRSDWVIY
jgi:Periplasmic binding protein